MFLSNQNYIFISFSSFPPPWVEGEESLNWLLKAAADNWGEWLSQDSIDNILRLDAERFYGSTSSTAFMIIYTR